MKNQFYYDRIVKVEKKNEGDPDQIVVKDSFSLDLVLLSIATPTGRTVVLNHVHERVEQVPVRSKQGRITAVRNEKGMYQTEIPLNQVDGERFIKATSVDVD